MLGKDRVIICIIENGYLSHQGDDSNRWRKRMWTGLDSVRGRKDIEVVPRSVYIWAVLLHLSPMGAVSHRYTFSSLHLPFSERAESERGLTPQSHQPVMGGGGPSDVEVSTPGV